MGIAESGLSLIYLVFGIAAVSGGAFGGTLADKFGSERVVLTFIIIYATMLFTISHTTFYLPLFLLVLSLWGLMSWSVTPPMQSYLMAVDPDTADMQISISNSALHFGIAFGSFVGGVSIDKIGVEVNPYIGGLFVILSFGTMLISILQKNKRQEIKSY